ncbi:MAG: GIY-YIG nuclease family protein, partial [Cyclobacteriaceae bacterium]|nr:GIY-YIG nuclease family protein [Cyclobacteriaceae bacterium]
FRAINSIRVKHKILTIDLQNTIVAKRLRLNHAFPGKDTGQTQDFDNRLAEHNRGETPSIKSCVPWKLVWSKDVENRSEAAKLEKR